MYNFLSHYDKKSVCKLYFGLIELSLFLKEHLGKIVFLIGVVLLVLAILFFSQLGSLESAFSLFFGLILVFFGIFAEIGVFSVKLRSLVGVSTVLICASVVLFAFSIAIIQFVDVKITGYIQEVFKGAPTEFVRIIFHSERPFLGLVRLLILASILTFVAAILLRVFQALR